LFKVLMCSQEQELQKQKEEDEEAKKYDQQKQVG
jgi:hypothetical protein